MVPVHKSFIPTAQISNCQHYRTASTSTRMEAYVTCLVITTSAINLHGFERSPELAPDPRPLQFTQLMLFLRNLNILRKSKSLKFKTKTAT